MSRGDNPKREHDSRVHSKGLMMNRHYRNVNSEITNDATVSIGATGPT